MVDRSLFKYFRFTRSRLLLAVLYKYLLLGCNVLLVVLAVQFLRDLFLPPQQRQNQLALAHYLGGIALGRFLLHYLTARNSHAIATRVKSAIRGELFKKVKSLELAYLERRGTAPLVSVAVQGVEMLEIYFAHYVPQLIYSLTVPLFLFAGLAFITLPAPLVMLLSVPLIPLSIILYTKRAKRLMKGFWSSYEDLGKVFLENLQGLVTLKLFGRDSQRAEELTQKSQHFRRRTMGVLKLQLSSIFFMDFFSLGGAAAGILLAAYGFSQGQLSLEGALLVTLLSSQFFVPLRRLGSLFHAGMNGVAAAQEMQLFLQEENPLSTLGTKEAEEFECLSLQEVSFSYDKQRKVLKGISLEIKRGEKVALVGKSGSGKSTVGHLILRLMDPDRGQILYNGTPLSAYDLASLRRRVGVVSQFTYIFSGTIRENLLIAKEDATEEELQWALHVAGLDSFVASLPKGLETNTGEWGRLLSGGQRQRLSLARAVLKGSELYIFDEATSSVEAEMDLAIWKNLMEVIKDRTAIVISHRLDRLTELDHTYYLEEGALLEEGSHKELMAAKGSYCELFSRSQLREVEHA